MNHLAAFFLVLGLFLPATTEPAGESAGGPAGEPPGELPPVGVQGEQAIERAAPGATEARAQLRIDELIVPHPVFALYVRPGETRTFDLVLTQPGGQYAFLAEGGRTERVSSNRWRWTAPETPGLYALAFDDPAKRRPLQLSVFVMRPLAAGEDGRLNGYRIGQYPDEPLRGDPKYEAPEYLVEVTESNRDTLVSPHFRLRQFLTKQGGAWPRYVHLDERLLLKLELILAKVREEGFAADTLHVMSGYRTPWYNRSIGNVEYSRHVYGDASDIFVDIDGDGRMDDLNGDGEESFADAEVLAGWIEALQGNPYHAPLVGGLGRYGPKPHRGPFVHVDTRGTAARWDAP